MEIGESKKLQVNLCNKIYIYRGEVLAISEDGCFVTLQDVKCGAVRIRISDIVIEEDYNG